MNGSRPSKPPGGQPANAPASSGYISTTCDANSRAGCSGHVPSCTTSETSRARQHHYHVALAALDIPPSGARAVTPRPREFRTGATPVPHDAPAGRSAPAEESAELDDLLEVDFVSPEGIDLNGEADGRSHQADDFRGAADERSELVGLPEEGVSRKEST